MVPRRRNMWWRKCFTVTTQNSGNGTVNSLQGHKDARTKFKFNDFLMQLAILLLPTGRQSCTVHFLVPEYSSNNSSRLSCTVHMLLVGLPTHFSVPDTVVEVVVVVVGYPARAVGWFAKTLFGPWYPLTSLPPTSFGHLGHRGHAQAHEQYWPESDLFRAGPCFGQGHHWWLIS